MNAALLHFQMLHQANVSQSFVVPIQPLAAERFQVPEHFSFSNTCLMR